MPSSLFLGGDCVTLFDGAGLAGIEFEPVEVIGSPRVTHTRYRVGR